MQGFPTEGFFPVCRSSKGLLVTACRKTGSSRAEVKYSSTVHGRQRQDSSRIGWKPNRAESSGSEGHSRQHHSRSQSTRRLATQSECPKYIFLVTVYPDGCERNPHTSLKCQGLHTIVQTKTVRCARGFRQLWMALQSWQGTQRVAKSKCCPPPMLDYLWL